MKYFMIIMILSIPTIASANKLVLNANSCYIIGSSSFNQKIIVLKGDKPVGICVFIEEGISCSWYFKHSKIRTSVFHYKNGLETKTELTMMGDDGLDVLIISNHATFNYVGQSFLPKNGYTITTSKHCVGTVRLLHK